MLKAAARAGDLRSSGNRTGYRDHHKQRFLPFSSLYRYCQPLRAIGVAQDNSIPSANSEHFNVANTVIKPVYRSTPWDAERQQEQLARTKARILFVGESNVCRSLLAVAMFQKMIRAAGLDDVIECESKGSRDHQLGESYPAVVSEVAAELGLQLPSDFEARQFNPELDIVNFDLVLVMDKFTAADVMREVAGYDLINKAGSYSSKVRQLGEFHPVLSQSNEPDAQDIDDPLYGNMGGPEEKAAVAAAAATLQEACFGLLQFVRELHSQAGSDAGTAQRLRETVRGMQRISWLVPPMLQGRVQAPKADGFV